MEDSREEAEEAIGEVVAVAEGEVDFEEEEAVEEDTDHELIPQLNVIFVRRQGKRNCTPKTCKLFWMIFEIWMMMTSFSNPRLLFIIFPSYLPGRSPSSSFPFGRKTDGVRKGKYK